MTRFYLGLPKPYWMELDELEGVPTFPTRDALARRKTLPTARGPVAVDSNGFTVVQRHGHWNLTDDQFIDQARYIIGGIGRRPDFMSPQDWMCEPWVIYGKNQHLPHGDEKRFHGTREARGLRPGEPEQDLATAIRIHQRLTVDNFVNLRRLAPDIPWMPVLQGYPLDSYLECAQMYADAGVDLASEPIVGLGSVCRRQAEDEIAEIAGTFADMGLRLHGFGVKKLGLPLYGPDLVSADSMAWSQAGRHEETGCDYRRPGSRGPHKNEANCLRYALRWRDDVLRILARPPAGRQLAIDFTDAA